MLDSVDAFRRLLWVILLSGLAAVMLTFAGLIVSRLIRRATERARARVEARHQASVDGLLRPEQADAATAALTAAPRRHRAVIGAMLLRPLRVARGDLVAAIARAAAALELDREWRGALHDRHWWVRADAARALGLLRDRASMEPLLRILDDEHEEVRAAAVESLGLIGDPAAIPPLLARLADDSRHQRVRVIEALRLFGEEATPSLIRHARAFPDDRLIVATVLGQIGGTDAVPHLLEWMTDHTPGVRAAAVAAAGRIGLDDRAYYFVLKALSDDSAAVRAAAARALGGRVRAGTAPYLEPLLDDEWDVATHAALSLKRLGVEGIEALTRLSAGTGTGSDLARQMLWDGGRQTGDV